MRLRAAVILATILCSSVWGQTYTISTFAGGGIPANISGTSATWSVDVPRSIAADRAGNLYFVDQNSVLRLDATTGVLTLVAGNGEPGFSGDNGPATSAQLANPAGLAVDSAGNLYIADGYNYRIREVSNGVITALAGNGTPGFSGDNGPATSAQLGFPSGIAVDSAGNLYIADTYNHRVRKVSNGVITNVAGGGPSLGDNGPAASAQVLYPYGVAVDSAGNLYIADSGHNRVRKVSNGVITTVAGNGVCCFSGDNGPAASAQLYAPGGVAMDSAGSLYIADTVNNRIRKVSNGLITTVAGNGTQGFSGDNGPGTSAQLNRPGGVAVDSAGNLYIADTWNNRIRKVSGGVITTVAGNGTQGFSGDNGPATIAQLANPAGVAVDSAGNLYITDTWTYRVRKVSNGVITTAAGNGTPGSSGDNGPATNAQLGDPEGIAVDSAGNLYVADGVSCRIRKVSNGVITTVAGNGTQGFSGDNGPATGARLWGPAGVAVDSAGNLYIADTGNNSIRKVSNGVIATVAGIGTLTSGFSGDNGPATSAQLGVPEGVAVDGAGNVYIADSYNNRIRVLTLASPCTYSLSPATLQAPALGGSLTVGIQTSASCSWMVSGLPGWIAVSGASSGAGSASVALAVFPNNSGATLSATVSIAGVSVTVTQPAAVLAPLAPIRSVTNAASYATGPVSPGEMVTIFGTGIGPAAAAYATTDRATGKLATTIGGVEVLFNGTAAPMTYASSTQVSAVVPYEMAFVANPSVWINCMGQTSNAYQLSLASAAPGLFAQNSSGSGAGAILNQDNSLNGPAHPAAKGSIVQIYMTGEGQTSPQPVTGAITTLTLPPPQVTPAPVQPVQVWIAGQPALYTYAGEAPGMVAGVMQLNVQIPANAPSGALSILVSIGGNVSQSGITVSVQ